MKIDKAGLDLIKHFEGFVHCPYLDTALVPTIGYGTTHYGGRPVSMDDDDISEHVASIFLETQVNDVYAKAVNHYVRVPINQNQFDSLVSFAYNLGTGALKSSTLLRLINQGELTLAADHFAQWCHVNGRVSKGLVYRREQERELFLS